MENLTEPAEILFAENIRMMPIDELVPYERNAKIRSGEQVRQNAASIREFGFSEKELDDLLTEEQDGGGCEEEPETPEPTDNPVCVRGDNLILGCHRLMCGDATGIGDVEKLMIGEKAVIESNRRNFTMLRERLGKR